MRDDTTATPASDAEGPPKAPQPGELDRLLSGANAELLRSCADEDAATGNATLFAIPAGAAGAALGYVVADTILDGAAGALAGAVAGGLAGMLLGVLAARMPRERPATAYEHQATETFWAGPPPDGRD